MSVQMAATLYFLPLPPQVVEAVGKTMSMDLMAVQGVVAAIVRG
jgi:hypothetical protein